MKRLSRIPVFAAVFLFGLSITHAATNTWTGNGDWFSDTGNWDQGGVPSNGDEVVISSGSVLLTNQTADLSSLTMDGGVLTFSNWTTCLTATNVQLNAGTVALPGPFTNSVMSNRVWIVCSNLFLASSATMNVDGCGYRGGTNVTGLTNGWGPGRGLGALSGRGSGGGGHGGRGGGGSDNWNLYMSRAGATCGSSAQPATPGSGGGAQSGPSGDYGGNGGGVARIDASGTFTINGTITSRGTSGYKQPGSAFSSGSGAGGSIWITCNTIAGTNGLIRVNGGNPPNTANFAYNSGGGGGGGRIAIDYDPVAQSNMPAATILFSAAGGKNLGNRSLTWWGDVGTLWFSDAQFLTATPSLLGQVLVPGMNSWAISSFTVSNTWIRLPAGDLTMVVTGDLSVVGTDASYHRLELVNTTVSCGGDLIQQTSTIEMSDADPGPSSLSCSNLALSDSVFYMYRGATSGPSLSCSGDITVQNSSLSYYFPVNNPTSVTVAGSITLNMSAALHLYSGMTNGAGPDYGGIVNLGQDIMVLTNSWLYPHSNPTNGGSILLRARDLTIGTANGGIAANAAGFTPPYAVGADGYGPGKGKGGWNSTGGGHGGLGGKFITVYGQMYGSSNMPGHAGSAGGQGNSPGADRAGSGGGVIRLEVSRTMTVNGTLTANGGNHTGQNNYGGGGGSGGSIYVRCRTLTGTDPVLCAAGGVGCDNRNTAGSGGGGGGRIAVWRAWDTTTGATTDVSGGGGYRPGTPGGSGDPTGGVGTVVWIYTGPTITNLPATNVTDTNASVVADLTYTGMAPTEVYCYWGQTNGLNDKGAWATNDCLGTNALGVITNGLIGIAPGTHYYYRFYATNAYGDHWGTPSADFSTLGGATVDNDIGATEIAENSTRLHGDVTGGNPTPAAYVCWGDNNPGVADTGSWDYVTSAGLQLGPYSIVVSNLPANKTYYYRCFATNVTAGGWAPSVSSFTTLGPTLSVTDGQVTEGDGGTTNLELVISISTTSDLPVSVYYSTVNGTATSGSDYSATNGTLIIGAGAVSGTVTVVVNGDTTDEYPHEVLFLDLSSPTNASIGDARAEATILEDDITRQTKTWAGTGNWTNTGNWTSPNEPGPTDDVVIPAGSDCTLAAPTAPLSSLVISNATLTVTNWNTALYAVDITIKQGGVLTLPGAFTDAVMSNNILIVCSNLYVETGGSIDVNGKGYSGGGTVHTNGYGPGYGLGKTVGGAGGGAYGGRGGGGYQNWKITPSLAGSTYGAAANPASPGSGGGGHSQGYVGGDGGGAIRINASGTVTVDGTITACGGQGTGQNGGSFAAGHGSGGGIWISCRLFDGSSGSVLANGATPLKFGQAYGYVQGGGGGGGRIEIDHDPSAQNAAPVPDVHISAAGGNDTAHLDLEWFGDLGTVYLPNERLLAAPILSHNGSLVVPGLTEWAQTNLLMSNAWIRIADDGFLLTLTNDLMIVGEANNLNSFGLTNATVTCGGSLVQKSSTFTMNSGSPSGSALQCDDLVLSDSATINFLRGGNEGTVISCIGDVIVSNATLNYYFPLTNPASFSVDGSMTLTDAGAICLYAGMTNGAGLDYGGLVDVKQTVLINSNCWIYPYSHPVNGGSVLFRVKDLTVATSNAGINANKRGYPQGAGAYADGLGPGKGKAGWNSTGGGHGGLGGKAIGSYGLSYGSSNAPVDAGSAGGLGSRPGTDGGGLGGGVVRIDASGTVTINGALTANGGNHAGQNNYGGGGGAGGSIYILCKRLKGISPVFSAKGGIGCDNRNTAGSGGGAGGRIAIWRINDYTQFGSANVDGAVGYRPGVPAGCGDEDGAVGTIVWGWIAPSGTVFWVH